jgi:AcrR family transcriptional regulator
VTTRAGVCERTFTDVFATVDECYRSAFEEGLDRLLRTVARAAGGQVGWLERVRSGLVAMLGFLDDEPRWARLLLLDTPLNGAAAFECRQQLQRVLADLLQRPGQVGRDSGVSRTAGPPVLWATLSGELLVGGVLSVIRTSMLEQGDRGKLVELAPTLMAFIVAPHLGQAAAQAELQGRPSGGGEDSANQTKLTRAEAMSRASALPIRATHRTTLVLRAIGQAPYSNNREIAQAAELADEGQTSKLLARLERRGVIENVGIGAARGEPNAWLLTASGRQAVELLKQSLDAGALRRRGTRSRGMA